MPDGVRTDPHIFLSIAKDGTVTIVAARAEMGNGAARTSLPMIMADELDANCARVRIVQGEGDEKKYGNQDTDGSRSVRHWLQPLRQCGATARLMLEQAAAKRWDVAERGRGRPTRAGAQTNGPQARLRRGRRGGRGAADPDGRQNPAKGSERVPLHRQGQCGDRRPVRHHDRTRHLRAGRDAAGHEVRRHRSVAGGRRHDRLVRRQPRR